VAVGSDDSNAGGGIKIGVHMWLLYSDGEKRFTVLGSSSIKSVADPPGLRLMHMSS
jgi:hypothetical protein